MTAIALLLAAQTLASPLPKEESSTWIRQDDLRDYPGNATLTALDLMIDPKGRPVYCQVTRASGNAALDDHVCKTLLARARFKPATDERGKRAYGAWSQRLIWIPGPASRYSAELSPWDITVPLPSGMPNREVVVEVVALLNPEGLPISCQVRRPSDVAVLNDRACGVITQTKARPVLDAAGQAVPGVRTLTIAFYNR